jgi:hypothetical protein
MDKFFLFVLVGLSPLMLLPVGVETTGKTEIVIENPSPRPMSVTPTDEPLVAPRPINQERGVTK